MHEYLAIPNIPFNNLLCFHYRAMFTCGDSSFGRGDDCRRWQFADMFTMEYDCLRHRIGPCEFRPLYFCRYEGKVIPRTGKTEYQAMVRARDPVVCPLGSLAMYLFGQQYMDEYVQPPPVLAGKNEW